MEIIYAAADSRDDVRLRTALITTPVDSRNTVCEIMNITKTIMIYSMRACCMYSLLVIDGSYGFDVCGGERWSGRSERAD